MRKNLGFTLVEVLVAVALTGVILLTGYSAFQRIMEAQATLWAAIDVQKNLFYTNEKLASLIRGGGSIDYEEYFNRRMLGYDQEKRPDGIFTFKNYSHFWNGNDSGGKQMLYYCGVSTSTGEECLETNAVFDASLYPASLPPAGDATIPITSATPPPFWHQPYGQYAALAYNYLNPGFPLPIKLPPVFTSAGVINIASRDINGAVSMGNQNIIDIWLPELYLIKQNLDNSYTRTYFRHVYVQDPFTVGSQTCTPTTSLDGCLGKIQITKLEACDTVWTPDGIIDAWIPSPEFAIWTVVCPTLADLSGIYQAAHEEEIDPGDIPPNLNWIDVTSPDMNVVRATFLPNPLKIPTLMSPGWDDAQSPRVSVYLEVALSTKLRNKSFIRTDMNHPRILITTYDLSE